MIIIYVGLPVLATVLFKIFQVICHDVAVREERINRQRLNIDAEMENRNIPNVFPAPDLTATQLQKSRDEMPKQEDCVQK